MKIFDLTGKSASEIKLPKVFSTPVREDIIKRAVLAIQANRRQPYAPNVLAGQRTSAHYHGIRKGPHHMMNRELGRLRRTHNSSPQQEFRARGTSQSVSGIKAHRPKTEKVWEQKINKKESMLALKSAIAATSVFELVKSRGHKIPESISLPLILKDDLEKISKTKELKNIILSLNLEEELKRGSKKKIRAGKGKMRGRKYKKAKSFLFVIEKDEGITKAVSSLPGSDICSIRNLNAELLAPGCKPGRLVIWTESAIKKLGELRG